MSRLPSTLQKGTLTFSVESRLLREIGERLVKQPEVAFVELIKNAHDADAVTCEVNYQPPASITVTDTGHGMTFEEFTNGWMRIGTSAKENQRKTRKLGRVMTGEKGIGRFAVRFLGTRLQLRSVADDPSRGMRTLLTAVFNWPTFDRNEDLGKIRVPYELVAAADNDEPGTTLTITQLREPARTVNLDAVRTAAISVASPFRALLGTVPSSKQPRGKTKQDPGFSLIIHPAFVRDDDGDVANAVLNSAVLRAVVNLKGDRLSLRVFRYGKKTADVHINDRYPNSIDGLYADIRFFPQRAGTFAGLAIKGPVAKAWVKRYAGVAVFDRDFRVLPYGTEGDDWLELAADAVRNVRDPQSPLAAKYFPMDDPTRMSTQLNYMLRLPNTHQLVGVVQIEGRRSKDKARGDLGLIPAADREGFVDNSTFQQLWNVVRGAVEAIAFVDRQVQQEDEAREQKAEIQSLRTETRTAIRQIQRNPHLRIDDKRKIVEQLTQVQSLAQQHEERSRDMDSRLEVMSLLGVVAGFMTHEFGVALDVLEKGRRVLMKLAKHDASCKLAADEVGDHIGTLREFVTYSQGYIQGANAPPTRPYPARPRIQQVIRVFGKYADARGVDITVDIAGDVMAPLVPVSLYGGLGLNLYTNALKAVIARAGTHDRRIAFHAWNEGKWHHLEVLDTGVGIPNALRERVFDPLFTTTASNRDPLGSGLGLGLTLVKRAVESYGGKVQVITPPEGFSTCVAVRLPLAGD
jgi:signal transduction histidine kinase